MIADVPNSVTCEVKGATVGVTGRSSIGKVLITSLQIGDVGATGFVGSRLVTRLLSEGYKVKVFTRNVDRAKSKLPYPELEFFGSGQWDSEICGCYAIVNLAGEPIATRWTEELKAEIKQSRVEITKRISDAIKSCSGDSKPKVLVSSSAIGYYGTSTTSNFSETSPSGKDYLAEICQQWEAAAEEASDPARVVVIRTGLVLGRGGGVLGRMVPVFNLFAGGPLASGQQWVSWIHRDDLVSLIMRAIEDDSFKGVYNGTAPNPVRMTEFCNAVGSTLGRPSWLPVPDFALSALLGEGALLVIEGQKVLPARTQKDGFEFKYTEIKQALQSILK